MREEGAVVRREKKFIEGDGRKKLRGGGGSRAEQSRAEQRQAERGTCPLCGHGALKRVRRRELLPSLTLQQCSCSCVVPPKICAFSVPILYASGTRSCSMLRCPPIPRPGLLDNKYPALGATAVCFVHFRPHQDESNNESRAAGKQKLRYIQTATSALKNQAPRIQQ